MAKQIENRKSGIPAGNAGEYFVMGELLRQGFDAQLAGRGTEGYDLLAGRGEEPSLRKIQVKTVRRAQSWWVKTANFKGNRLDQITVYVLLGPQDGNKPVRFFIAKNRDLKEHVHRPWHWKKNAFMPMKAVKRYENRWKAVLA